MSNKRLPANVQKISTDADFPHVSVVMESRAKGPRFGVNFWNWEHGPLVVRFFKNLLLGPLVILFGLAWVWLWIGEGLGFWTFAKTPYDWMIFAVGGAGVALAMVPAYWLHRPVLAWYEIVVDPIEDTFVVCRKAREKKKLRRPLSRLAALSLGPHPDLPLEYEKNRTGKAGPKQKQRPSEQSLFEVQQALEWTLQIVHKMYELAAAPQGIWRKDAPGG
jgi:hypothetical protein